MGKKRILLCTLLSIVFLLSPAVLAQNLELDYRYNAVVENFLWHLQAKRYDRAFTLTSGILAQTGLENFKESVNKMGLTDFTDKTWTNFTDEMNKTGVTKAKGEFFTPDGITHYLTFYFIIGGETEIKIGTIAEEIANDSLVQRFPKQTDLYSLILKSLSETLPLIKKNKMTQLYKYLSEKAKTRTNLKDIKKALSKLRKIRKNIYLPKNGNIILSQESPLLSQDGLMIVNGTFENKKSLINFTLGYDYEDWNWKLGLLGIDAKNKP